MAIQVLVVVNFYDAGQHLRNAFTDVVSKSDWQHHPCMPNAFYKSFFSSLSDGQLIESCEKDMGAAAKDIGLPHWDANCVIGEPGWLVDSLRGVSV